MHLRQLRKIPGLRSEVLWRSHGLDFSNNHDQRCIVLRISARSSGGAGRSNGGASLRV